MLLGVLRQVEQALLLEVVADEVRLGIDDELAGQRLGSRIGQSGCGRLGALHVEDRPEYVVHGEEGRGHAGAAGEELAPAQPVTRREVAGQRVDA